jgi:uncharacterized membrane protein
MGVHICIAAHLCSLATLLTTKPELGLEVLVRLLGLVLHLTASLLESDKTDTNTINLFWLVYVAIELSLQVYLQWRERVPHWWRYLLALYSVTFALSRFPTSDVDIIATVMAVVGLFAWVYPFASARKDKDA